MKTRSTIPGLLLRKKDPGSGTGSSLSCQHFGQGCHVAVGCYYWLPMPVPVTPASLHLALPVTDIHFLPSAKRSFWPKVSLIIRCFDDQTGAHLIEVPNIMREPWVSAQIFSPCVTAGRRLVLTVLEHGHTHSSPKSLGRGVGERQLFAPCRLSLRRGSVDRAEEESSYRLER